MKKFLTSRTSRTPPLECDKVLCADLLALRDYKAAARRGGFQIRQPQARRNGEPVRGRVHQGADSSDAAAAQDAHGRRCQSPSAGSPVPVIFFSHHHLRFLTQHTVFKVDSRSTPHAAHAEMCYLWEGWRNTSSVPAPVSVAPALTPTCDAMLTCRPSVYTD